MAPPKESADNVQTKVSNYAVHNDPSSVALTDTNAPPQLPAAYANWSPASHRRAMNPAGIARQISAPNPVPFHFNRPSPNNSPILIRKNRNPSPSKPHARPMHQNSPIIPEWKKHAIKNEETESTTFCKPRQLLSSKTSMNSKQGEHKKEDEHFSNKTVPMHCSDAFRHGAQSEQIGVTHSALSDMSRVESQSDSTSLDQTVKELRPDATRPPPAVESCWSDSTANVLSSSQAPWRAVREEHKQTSSSSVSSCVAVKTLLSESSEPKMSSSTAEMNGQITVHQPHSITQEVPWRSPQTKRKDLTKPPQTPATSQSNLAKEPIMNQLNIKTESVKVVSEGPKITSSSSSNQISNISVTESTTTKSCESSSMSVSSSSSVVVHEELKVAEKSEEKLIKETEKIENKVKAEQNITDINLKEKTVSVQSSEIEEVKVQGELISNSNNEAETSGKALVDSTTCQSFPQTVTTSIPPPPPPPPKYLKNETISQPRGPPGMPLLPIQNPKSELEQDLNSPEYTLEPVTRRIQKFEKQSSFESEKKEKQIMGVAKPVGPWVKKTSSGPVQPDMWDPLDRNLSETMDSICFDSSKVQKSRQSDVSASSSVKMVLSQPLRDNVETRKGACAAAATAAAAVEESSVALQSKQLQKLIARPRTRSTGEYVHSYVDQEGADKSQSTTTGPSKPGISPLVKNNKTTPALFDPWCDPSNPRVIQFQDISAAAFKIKSGVLNTPCTRSNISTLVNSDIFFKKEFNQYTGSFKERGARYTLLCLSEEHKKKGVIAASAGNHALALSYHGQDLGVPVTVVMPLVAPIMKVQACRQYGANILVKGKDIGECRDIALKMANEQNLTYINGYDHPHILAGQGTMGLEIVEQVPNIDAVVIPVGGGGLIAGVALAVKSLYPHIKIIGVESEKCTSFSAAMKAGKPVYTKAESSLADGLAVPTVGVNAFATARTLVDKVVSVREEWIAIAILRLVEIEKAVVEGAGAAALAALLAGELPELVGKRVVIPLCGGNIDTTILGRCLDRGLAADGRLVKFTVTVSDRPGGIADLTRLLANLGVSIKDMLHERAWIRSDIFSVEVKVLCETRDHEHSEELREILQQKYELLRFGNVKCVVETRDYDHMMELRTELQKKYSDMKFPDPEKTISLTALGGLDLKDEDPLFL